MCIAIVKPADKVIDRETLEICAENNPDGCGFAYINEDDRGVRRIKVRKAMEFDEFYEKYEKALKYNAGSTFLIHFRIKTHGHVDLANCHPFKIDKDHVFIHNGTIHKVDQEDGMSDTRVFNRDVLRILPKNWNKQTGIKKLIEEFIGYSKLAVMDINGDVNIYNEAKGQWIDGVWYSNDGYKRTPPVRATSVFKGGVKTTTYNYGTSGTINTGNKIVRDLTQVTSKIASSLKRRAHYEMGDYVPCDCCGIYSSVARMQTYYDGRDCISFCLACCNEQDVWYFFDPEDAIDTDSYLDWLNGMDTDDTMPVEYEEKWENPWGLAHYDEMYTEIYENEEAMENVYQLQHSLA